MTTPTIRSSPSGPRATFDLTSDDVSNESDVPGVSVTDAFDALTPAPISFTPLLVPEIANNGSWFSPSRGIGGLGTTSVTITDQCTNPLVLTTDALGGVYPSLLTLGRPTAFVGTLGFAGGSGAFNPVAAAKLQATTELYAAGWVCIRSYQGLIGSLIAQYDAGAGAKRFALYETINSGGSIAFRCRNDADTGNIVISFPQPTLNEPHFIEGVLKNGVMELWRDRVLMASAVGPTSIPNTSVGTSIFNETSRGNPLAASSGNIYCSTRVPSDSDRDLLYRFERLSYNRIRQYAAVAVPVLAANAIGTVTVVTVSALVGSGPYVATPPPNALAGGGTFLGVRPVANGQLTFTFLGPTTGEQAFFLIDEGT